MIDENDKVNKKKHNHFTHISTKQFLIFFHIKQLLCRFPKRLVEFSLNSILRNFPKCNLIMQCNKLIMKKHFTYGNKCSDNKQSNETIKCIDFKNKM